MYPGENREGKGGNKWRELITNGDIPIERQGVWVGVMFGTRFRLGLGLERGMRSGRGGWVGGIGVPSLCHASRGRRGMGTPGVKAGLEFASGKEDRVRLRHETGEWVANLGQGGAVGH